MYDYANSGLQSNYVVSLAIDDQGNKWIGSWSDGGLAKFDGENWVVYNPNDSGLPNNKVFPIVIDNQGSIWIGTNGGGLVVYQQGGVK